MNTAPAKSRPNTSRNILLLFLLMAGVATVSSWLMPHDVIPWRLDYAAAREESAQSGKPLMLYFTADWCGPCQTMKRTTWADGQVRDALGRFVPLKIDIDQNQELALRYAVAAIPRIVVLDAAAADRVVASHEGFIEPGPLIQLLQPLAGR